MGFAPMNAKERNRQQWLKRRIRQHDIYNKRDERGDQPDGAPITPATPHIERPDHAVVVRVKLSAVLLEHCLVLVALCPVVLNGFIGRFLVGSYCCLGSARINYFSVLARYVAPSVLCDGYFEIEPLLGF